MKKIVGLDMLKQPIENIKSYSRGASSFDGATVFIEYYDGERQTISDSMSYLTDLVNEIERVWSAKR